MKSYKKTLSALSIAALLGITACGDGMGGEATEGEGFEYLAEQNEVDEAIGELDPVTISFQTLAPSGEDPLGKQALEFKELAEERSNGQIEVEVIWGMAAAGFDEVRQAVVDGRIDIGYTNPIYYPAEFPIMNAYATATALLDTGPFQNELVAQAVGRELAAADENVQEEYTSQDLVPLVHIMNQGYVNMCNEPVREVDEWSGKQVRIASVTQADMVDALGGSGVSTDITEAYEALQRGTVSCILTQTADSITFGYADVAPEIGYTQETSIPRSPAIMFAGPRFNDLPLPYQQILFDSLNESMAAWTKGGVDGWPSAFERVEEAGGEIAPISSESEQIMAEVTDEAIDGLIEEGNLPESIREDIPAFEDKWNERAVEMGYENGGDIEELLDWYDHEADFVPWYEELIADENLTDLRPR